jgi:Domain of unknown function DUF29
MADYDKDVFGWAFEQAQFLRQRRFDLLDIEHLANEIEFIGKTRVRDLAKQISGLLADLLKWQYLPAERTAGYRAMIELQRSELIESLEESPSSSIVIEDAEMLQLLWNHVLAQTMTETELCCLPTECPWEIKKVLTESWLPA